ncbi:MAG: Pvc16 family protein [Bryobacteraceae bacterium]|nr:Pvc16 family protein [Bryobacteraceae bacterium]
MIRDLTESLEAFLNQPGLPTELAAAVVRFDRPSEPYTPTETTINLFLFDVRENLELRNNEPITRRVGMQTIIERPPLRVTCTYLVTAWPVGGLDLPKQEHRLISQVFQLFASSPIVPPAFLTGSLIGQDPPVLLVMSQPDGMRNPAEFWAAIGNKMKPAILLAVTFSMVAAPEETFPAVISSGIEINGVMLFRIAGVVTDNTSTPVPDATVELIGRGRTTVTNSRGEWTIAAVAAGAHTIRAVAGPLNRTRAITVPAPAGSDYNVQFT